MRGAVYRDPTEWRNGLRVIRNLQPEHVLSTHTRSLSGKEKVFDVLTNYMDLISLTYDQTLRGILRGLGIADLRYFIYKPQRLAEPSYNAETCGETPWFPPATFQFQMGWFDRDATTIVKLPLRDEAERLVELMGGKARLVEQARQALRKRSMPGPPSSSTSRTASTRPTARHARSRPMLCGSWGNWPSPPSGGRSCLARPAHSRVRSPSQGSSLRRQRSLPARPRASSTTTASASTLARPRTWTKS